MIHKLLIGTAAVGLLASGAASAHHSFAVFFDEDRVVKIAGEVRSFRFANPHGTIALAVPTRSGEVREWRVETNSPSVLTRRGWSRDTLKPGQEVTVEGWLARDGSRYLRLRQAYDANGQPVSDHTFSTLED